jgi:small acid-soluble spore protein B (major beta-type SASP)
MTSHNKLASLQNTSQNIQVLKGVLNTMAGRNQLLVPQCKGALNQMKTEAAQEQNVQLPTDGYYGNMTSRDTGSLGGYITKKLVQIAEQSMSSGQGGQMR